MGGREAERTVNTAPPSDLKEILADSHEIVKVVPVQTPGLNFPLFLGFATIEETEFTERAVYSFTAAWRCSMSPRKRSIVGLKPGNWSSGQSKT